MCLKLPDDPHLWLQHNSAISYKCLGYEMTCSTRFWRPSTGKLTNPFIISCFSYEQPTSSAPFLYLRVSYQEVTILRFWTCFLTWPAGMHLPSSSCTQMIHLPSLIMLWVLLDRWSGNFRGVLVNTTIQLNFPRSMQYEGNDTPLWVPSKKARESYPAHRSRNLIFKHISTMCSETILVPSSTWAPQIITQYNQYVFWSTSWLMLRSLPLGQVAASVC